MTLTIIEHDADAILARVLARYRTNTGVELAAADPRRLLVLTFCQELAQQAALADFGSKQSLVDYVVEEFVAGIAALWGDDGALLEAGPSTCTVRFTFSTSAANVVPAGKRVTNGAYVWAVTEDTTGAPATTYVDAVVECTTDGAATNGVTAGLINTLVDPFGTCTAVANTTTTANGRDVEDIEDWRVRVKALPDLKAVAGPYESYRALARAADTRVHTVECLGPNDAADMAYYDPPAAGEVAVLVTQAILDSEGEVDSLVPEPSGDLLAAVEAYLSDETRRPLGDSLTVRAPEWVDADVTFTYWIATSRSGEAATIQAAVDDAVEAYQIWQQQIGRDLDPGEIHARVRAAGAKRLSLTAPPFLVVGIDECVRIGYVTVTYGGIEAD